MRKIVFISLLALLTLSSCVCHNLGLKTGVNVATLNGDDTDDLDSRTGMFFGGFAELCITDEIAIQPEILYSQQGTKFSSEGYDVKFKLDYLNVPVMAKFKLSEEFMVEAGPQVGVLLSAKEEFESSMDSFEDDAKEDYKNIDFGANVGVAYQFENGLNLGARYNFGLSKVDENPDENKKNGVFQFSVGFRF